LRGDRGIDDAHHRIAHAQCARAEKYLPCSVFLQSHLAQTSTMRALPAIASTRHAVRPHRARQAQARCAVNTSLSEKLFFSSCWCIRDECAFDPRLHAAITAISHIGGQHGQESEEGEEGEEGEERSEEDCEEDPQGRQEEVTSLFEVAGS